MPERDRPRRVPVKLTVPEGLAAGQYANFMRAQATEHEFVLTFAMIVADELSDQGEAKATAIARIVVPHHIAPQIVDAINRTLEQYGADREAMEKMKAGASDQSTETA